MEHISVKGNAESESIRVWLGTSADVIFKRAEVESNHVQTMHAESELSLATGNRPR
jgi:hypothetical protein